MTIGTAARPHLVERALEAMGTAPLTFPSVGRQHAERPPVEVAAPAPAPQAPAPAARPPAVALARLQEAGLAFSVDAPARSKVTEEFALVQHPLLRNMQAEPNEPRTAAARRQVIMVTSARRGEGKSFTALNLGASIAVTTAQPVLLVDVDGGASSLSHRLGLAETPGLLGLVADLAQPKEPLLVPTAVERLSILPHGALATGASRPPAVDSLAAAIRSLAAALPRHVILLDTPPALSTSDAQALSSLVGQVIIVVRAESTQRNEVEAALDLVEACPLLHLLLNGTRFSTNDSFGADGEYGAPANA